MLNCVAGAITFKGAQKDLERLYTALTPDGKLSMNGVSPVPESLISEDNRHEYAIYEEAAVYAWAKDHPLSERNRSLLEVLDCGRSWDDLLEAGSSRVMLSSDEDRMDFIKLGRRCILNFNKFKCFTMDEWRIINWGVKWDLWIEDGKNVLSVPTKRLMDLVIHTSEDFPFAFMETLAKKFPSVSFSGSYAADEDNETIRGYISASGGVLTMDKRPDDLEIYTALWGEDADEF